MNKQEIVITEQEDFDVGIYEVLRNSLYPNAKKESIKLVMSYCKAAKLDIMHKLVYIVSMGGKDIILPGIGLYRIQASRTGQYAGIKEPEYGETVTKTLGVKEVTYPEWCKITIMKKIDGEIFEFTAKEYWLENYASKEKGTTTPNDMWSKRPYAQLAKCAEAQALRKAFPEAVGSVPTAEEMEGKELLNVTNNAEKLPLTTTKSKISFMKDKVKDLVSTIDQEPEQVLQTSKYSELQQELIDLIAEHEISDMTVQSWLHRANVDTFEELNNTQINKLINYYNNKKEG